jgi:serine phosphatase RsbU (regulator of sigma subunit)
MAAVILAGLALIVLMPGLGPVFGAMLAVGLLAGLTGTSYAAFAKAGVLLDPSFPAMAVAAMFGALFLSLHLESDRNRKILSASLRRQRIENARMAGELSAARDIQMGILPDTDSIEDLPQNIDVHAFLTPAREVGGDLYDVFMIDEHRLFFLVGDVSGKGVSAAMFMAMCKALCKNAAFRDTSQSISDLISTSNIELSRENPSYMFVTAIACVIDTRTGEMEYCNAGHEAPYLCRTGEAPVKLGGDGGPPLCVIDDFEYPLERIQLQAGDTILLFTDGVTDTINSEEQMYGADRLLDHLKSSPNDVAARSVVDALYQDIQRYAGDAAPWDDVAILCLRYLAPGDRDTDS